jgi:Tfp pilus assembly protein PilN
MTQVNLLPGDVKERQRTRRLTAAVILAVGAVMALLFFVFILQSARLSDQQHKLQAQEAVNADLNGKIVGLQEFAALKAQVANREALTAAALDGEVLWSGVLRDVSMVIPDKVFLTGIVGSLSAPVTSTAPVVAPPTPGTSPSPGTTTPTAPVVTGPGLIGTIQFTGMADDHPSVAQWLTRLEQVTGWVNPWISNATEVDQNGAPGVQWTGSLDLTSQATIQGGAR